MSRGASRRGECRELAYVAVLLIGVLASVYLTSYSSTFRLDDEHILMARTQSLALRGVWDEPQVYGNARLRELAAQGDPATQVEPLYTLLGSWLYRVGSGLGLGGAQAAFILNLFLVPLSAALIFLTIRLLGHGTPTAVMCALLFGIGTTAWPYSTTYVRDVLAMTMAAAAFLGWAVVVRGEGRRRVAGAGLLAAALVGGLLSKNTMAAVALAFLLAGFGLIVRGRPERLGRRLFGLALGIGGIGLIVGLVPESGPLARFSLDYYRFLASHFAASLAPELAGSILGPFVSPAKSLFLFSPPALLGVIGGIMAWRSGWRFALPALLTPLTLALAQALFYRERWAGTFGWGLRFMLPALPGLLALSAPIVDRWLGSRRGRLILGLLTAVSASVQLSGAWVSWRAVYDAWSAEGLEPFRSVTAWDPRFLAIPGQMARLASPSTWNVAWLRLTRAGEPLALLVPLVALAAASGLAALLIAEARAPGFARRRSFTIGLALAILASTPLPMLVCYRGDPALGGDRPEFRALLDASEAQARPGDVFVLDSYGTPLWAFLINRWTADAPWYSLAYEIPGSDDAPLAPGSPPSAATLALLNSLDGDVGRVWYVSSSEAPDDALGRESAWLDAHRTLDGSQVWVGRTVVEARIYRTGYPRPNAGD